MVKDEPETTTCAEAMAALAAARSIQMVAHMEAMARHTPAGTQVGPVAARP